MHLAVCTAVDDGGDGRPTPVVGLGQSGDRKSRRKLLPDGQGLTALRARLAADRVR